MKRKKRWIKWSMRGFIVLFILMNSIAILHSRKFTHFTTTATEKTGNPKSLTSIEKIKTLILGVSNPRPENKTLPSVDFSTIKLKSNREIECWDIKIENAKGTVAIFHGYGGNKSSMLDKSKIFNELGYNTFLVDFMGSGGSEGNQTTIGYLEAEQVRTSLDFLLKKEHKDVFLFGTSMGAVAIMKALNNSNTTPQGIILECPFGSMYETVCSRFKSMGLPTFPMADLLVFWGGLQNGFWAYGHQPTEYAKKINCPSLLLYGEKDEKVSRSEIEHIFKNLNGKKTFKTYSKAGHENYLNQYKDRWTNDIGEFLSENNSALLD